MGGHSNIYHTSVQLAFYSSLYLNIILFFLFFRLLAGTTHKVPVSMGEVGSEDKPPRGQRLTAAAFTMLKQEAEGQITPTRM